MSRIPLDASPGVQQAFRELWQALDTLLGGNNIDLGGRRIINAGDGRDAQDYVTKKQAGGAAGSASDPIDVDVVTVRKVLTVVNLLRFRTAAFSNPAAGTIQVTRGDGTTLGSFKLLELLFSGHARLTSTVDDLVDVKNTDGTLYATIRALKFTPSVRQTYTPTVVTTLRGGDFSALSTDDVRSIVGTLIEDLQTAGLLA